MTKHKNPTAKGVLFINEDQQLPTPKYVVVKKSKK